MGKNNETVTPASAITESPAFKETAKAAPETVATVGRIEAPPKPVAASPAMPAKTATKKKALAKKAAAKKRVKFSTEDIALRAYFIAEHRHRHGIHGDEHSDWVEAERQLRAEKKKKAAKKKNPSKKRV